MKRVLLAMASGLVLVVGMAAPSPAVTTGEQTFTIYYIGDEELGTNVAKGPISGIGTEEEIAFDGEGTGTDVATFDDGTVKLVHTDTDSDESFNETTCVGRFRGEGEYTLISGTGAYKGVSGGGTYTYKGTFFATRTADGCGDDGTSIVIIKASGTTTLP